MYSGYVMPRLLAAVFSILVSSQAFATPIKWQLSGVQFNDGGVASGSFIFDADTNTYSNVQISTTAGTASSGYDYGPTGIVFKSGGGGGFDIVSAIQSDLTGVVALALRFSPALTDDGGSAMINYSLSGEFNCGSIACATGGGGVRSVSGGSLTTVPIPASLALLGLGLIAMRSCYRRNT